jgi:hypothetical protein
MKGEGKMETEAKDYVADETKEVAAMRVALDLVRMSYAGYQATGSQQNRLDQLLSDYLKVRNAILAEPKK